MQEQRVALITGASAGLGRATADLLAERGWTVVGASRRGIGGRNWAGAEVDVDDDASTLALITSTLEQHGRIDALVCAAGYGLAGPVEMTSPAEAHAQFETNFWGTVRTITCALPHLRTAGDSHVVVMSSIAGEIGIPFQAFYSASKFALEGWAEALAYEVEPFGIHVTLVQPGNFATDFTDSRRLVAADPGPYAGATSHAVEVMENDERNGADPHAVALTIAAQLEARHPRRRISVGKADERIGLVAKRLLPHRWFERLAKDSLGVK